MAFRCSVNMKRCSRFALLQSSE